MSAYIERLIRIYNRLRRGPVTIYIISVWAKNAGIDVGERQLYRDLNTLLNLKFTEGENVVEYTGEKNQKTWKLEYESTSEQISQFDINSFFLFKNFVPNSIQQHRKESLEKFEKILYKSFSQNKYERQAEAAELYLRKSNWWDISYGEIEHKQIEDLLWALQNKRAIIVLSDEINSSVIDLKKYPLPVKLWPMEMIFHSGRVFITGLHATAKKLLVYSLYDNFKIELTDEVFNRTKHLKSYREQIDSRLTIEENKEDKIYNIKLEFSHGYGLAMQKVFIHNTAKWKELKNGNYMLEMKCGISRSLIGFIGHSLDQVKVHQPKVLRDLVIKKFRDTLDVYNGKDIDEEKANHDY